MPCFLLFTNVAASAIPKGFLSETTKIISKAIRKPEQFITVRIHPGQMMTHGGTTEPCANSELQAIGHISAEENIQMSKEISEFLKSKLGIDNTRNYIKFTNMAPHEVGYGGTTFGELFITVRIHPGQMMTHGGTTEPCANSELQAIGHISAEENIQMSKEISEFLKSKLGIDNTRNYIKFTNMAPHEVGNGGTTFGELVKDPKWAALM